MNRKPIVVLCLPRSDYFHIEPIDLMSAFNGHSEKTVVSEDFHAYLWFVFVDESLDAPSLQVFHEKDFTQIQYDDLFNLVKSEFDYWKSRCMAAEDVIAETPCDPDITDAQISAVNKWEELQKQRP